MVVIEPRVEPSWLRQVPQPVYSGGLTLTAGNSDDGEVGDVRILHLVWRKSRTLAECWGVQESGTTTSGGDVTMASGASTSGVSGSISISSAASVQTSGSVTKSSGDSIRSTSGDVSLATGTSTTTSGDINLKSGSATLVSGDVNIAAGDSDNLGGSVRVTGGMGGVQGGSIILSAGTSPDDGLSGSVSIFSGSTRLEKVVPLL